MIKAKKKSRHCMCFWDNRQDGTNATIFSRTAMFRKVVQKAMKLTNQFGHPMTPPLIMMHCITVILYRIKILAEDLQTNQWLSSCAAVFCDNNNFLIIEIDRYFTNTMQQYF